MRNMIVEGLRLLRVLLGEWRANRWLSRAEHYRLLSHGAARKAEAIARHTVARDTSPKGGTA